MNQKFTVSQQTAELLTVQTMNEIYKAADGDLMQLAQLCFNYGFNLGTDQARNDQEAAR